MPHKGFYTQCLAVLLSQPVSAEELEGLLAEFGPVPKEQREADWFGGVPQVLIPYLPDANGWVVVDVVDRPWPDPMGDPKSDPDLFGAWATGHFGLAWPRGFARACEHAWTWPELQKAPVEHAAFVRIRSSYVFGSGPDAPIQPVDYQPVPELMFVTRIAEALSRSPHALAYFNPAGERVLEPRTISKRLESAAAQDVIPIDLWANVRFYNLDEEAPGWRFMDTVGVGQLDAPDHEALYFGGGYASDDVNAFLWNIAAYVVDKGPVIADGDTSDGPGGVRWRASHVKEGRLAPPRKVIRWRPIDGRPFPGDAEAPAVSAPKSGARFATWLRALGGGRKQ